MKLLVAIPAVTVVFAAAAQTYRVSGTVVDSESGAPLNRTRVALTGGPAGELSVITTGNGRFSFDMPKGKYTLLAARRDWGLSYGQLGPASGSESAIITGPDQDTSQILFRFRAPGAIHGKVVDEAGEPVASAQVELFYTAINGGMKRLTSIGRAESDDFGDYSWSAIPGGTYYLVATGAPWYFSDQFARSELTNAGRPPAPYAPTYYPGVTDARGATPLVVRPGGEVQADFVLRPAAGANLSFVCPNSPCTGALKLCAMGLGGVETVVGTTGMPEPGMIPAVLAGRYVVRYTGDEGNMRKSVDVAGGDVTVEIVPKPGPSLTGQVSFQDSADPPRHPIYVALLDEDGGKPLTAPLGPDGRFSWTTVAAARVRFLLSSDDGFFVSKMSVDGASVKDGVIEMVDGAKVQLNVVASNETGRLKGVAMDGDKPAPGVTVVLAPATGANDPLRYLGYLTESDGSFDWPSVPAGDYVLFAVDNRELEYANPTISSPYLAGGKRVRIEPHDIQTLNIGLTQAAGR